MKVARVKPVIQGGKLIFKVQGETQEVPFDQVPGIDENLKRLNLQRHFLRKSKKTKSMSMGKRFM